MKNNYEYEIRNIDNLIPYANNSRTHTPDQVTQIASSLKEFGFTNPVLIDEDGGIIAGHGRVLAARKVNISDIPCIILSGLTKAQKKAYVIADNQLALNSGWDNDLLKLEIESLEELDFNIDLLGFDSGFLDDLFLDKSDKNDSIKDLDYQQSLSVIVTCESEKEQEQAYTLLINNNFLCQVQSL